MKKLDLKISFDSVALDGQVIEIPEELRSERGVEESPRLVNFITRVVYLVAHKRANYADYVSKAAVSSSFVSGDSSYQALMKSCCDFDKWLDSGWSLVDHERDDGLVIQKSGSKVKVRVSTELIDEIRPWEGGAPRVTVRASCFRPYLSPGYFFIVSPHGGPETEEIVRIYLNCSALGACRLILDLSRISQESKFKFHAKFRNRSDQYLYSDGGVIYLEPGEFLARRELLTDLFKVHAEHLSDKISYFTEPLVPGAAFAVERVVRGRGVKSFGEKKSAEFAIAHWPGHFKAPSTPADRGAAVPV
ncbi:T3SS effector HopA1 family protein [Luteimonas sp. FCS-9]|uniref:T3SS effector HopA1 family protein n=1 Tax=Luteimonas sp. FCS-9 TaxID=1547516 RepID=UPI000A49F9BD|nr:T3SS effector HopA1 family protein [Luteimonas sp. FCS-9]